MMLLLGTGLLGAALARSSDATSGVRDGGTFHVALIGDDFHYIDPALAESLSELPLLDLTCARLMRYPDKPPPEGFRLIPEVAEDYPGVSNNAKTFTFTLRRGFRFSNRAPVTPNAFATAINRTLAPGVETYATAYTEDIVGADAVRNGSQPSAKGVVAKGNRLVIRLKHPTPDFPARMTMTAFCAVPPNTPPDPEGIKTPLPAAGPYYVAEYVPGRKVVLKRNTHYGGTRPRHVQSFVADLSSTTFEDVIGKIETGKADWGNAGPPGAYFLAGLDKKYGINHRRFFVRPGLTFLGFAFNTSRGLFRDARLRRAVNYAVDRAEIRRITPGGPLVSTPTDRYLPPSFPHVRNADIYPLKGPKLGRAKELAGKRLTGRKVVIYMRPRDPPYRYGQALARNLEKLGLKVEVRVISIVEQIEPGGPWDLAFFAWVPDYLDPFAYLNEMFHGRFIGTSNFSGFNQPQYNRLLEDAARRRGIARERAYANLDVRLARDAAPIVPIDFVNQATFVSKHVDPRCRVLRPALDLAVVCLKR
jgi:peptide/nickel transport system substrate-binding protein